MSDQMEISPSPSSNSLNRDVEISNTITAQEANPSQYKSGLGTTATLGGVRPGIRARENDTPTHTDTEERPFKRARPLDSNDLDKAGSVVKGPGLSEAQQRHCESVLNVICRLPAAQPFLKPVDPIDAKAPDYFIVIAHPMDLGTIGEKLKGRDRQGNAFSYSSLQEFVEDVELVFANCFKYNGPPHPVSQLAVQVKQAFEKGMNRIPGGENISFSPVPVVPKELLKEGSTSSVQQLDAKRRSTYPPKKIAPAVYARSNRRDPLRISQEKFCKSVLDHLYRKEYETLAFPFLQPVDLDTYLDYLEKISKPMDLRTIHDKLSHGSYASADEFRNDIKLMFSNCYDYNPTWTPVWQCGKDLENIFDEKWKELPLTAPSATPPKKGRSSGGSATPQRQLGKKSKKSGSHSRLEPLNEDQKITLCETLFTLPDSKMEQVIDLIRKRLPQYRENDETLTLEFENLPLEVQAEMFDLLKLPRAKPISLLSSDSSDLSSADSD